MNARQRRKAMRRFGRKSRLDQYPLGLLTLIAVGESEQAEELRISRGLPAPLIPASMGPFYRWRWPTFDHQTARLSFIMTTYTDSAPLRYYNFRCRKETS